MLNIDKEIHYCKASVKDGTPIHVTNSLTREVEKTNHWSFNGYDEELNPICFDIKFDNSSGAAKKSGDRAVMKLRYINV